MDGLRYDFLLSLRATKLPPYLWRVQHVDSQVCFDSDGGLEAALCDHFPSSQYELRASLTRHLRWGFSKAGSHFISTFDSHALAVGWARAKLPVPLPLSDSNSEFDDETNHMKIYRIQTRKLRDSLVFNVATLVKKLNLHNLLLDRSGLEREFVILNSIPANAIEFIEYIRPSLPKIYDPVPKKRRRSTPWGRTLERREKCFRDVTYENLAKVQLLECLAGGCQRVSQREKMFCWMAKIEDCSTEEGENGCLIEQVEVGMKGLMG